MPTAATTKAGRKIDLTQPVQLRCRWVMAIKMSDLVRSFEKASPKRLSDHVAPGSNPTTLQQRTLSLALLKAVSVRDLDDEVILAPERGTSSGSP
jgi:hypothetical protein